MTQYSRIVTDSICDSHILSEIRGYFYESRITDNQSAVSVKSDIGRIECLPRLYSNNADSEIVLGIGVASFILFYIRSVRSREARLVGSARLSSLRCLRFSLARSSSGTDPDGSQWRFGSG